MRYIFSADLENVCLEIVDDPEETERRFAHIWSKSEFYQLVGILIPDNVELMSIEPDRDIYAVRYEGQDTEIFSDPADAPQFMKNIWANRYYIKMHLKAELMELRDDDFYDYHYDYDSDSIIKTPQATREHSVALRSLTASKMAHRMIVDLIDLLIQKGIFTEGELPAWFDLTQAKNILSKIDWDSL